MAVCPHEAADAMMAVTVTVTVSGAVAAAAETGRDNMTIRPAALPHARPPLIAAALAADPTVMTVVAVMAVAAVATAMIADFATANPMVPNGQLKFARRKRPFAFRRRSRRCGRRQTEADRRQARGE
jgi:hypothetical protein